MGGEVETMFNQITFIFGEEWYGNILSLIRKMKNKEFKFVNKNYISIVPKLIFFKTTDLYTIYLFPEYADN